MPAGRTPLRPSVTLGCQSLRTLAGAPPAAGRSKFHAKAITKALNLSGENVSVLARRNVVFAMAVLATDDTIAVVENPKPIERHLPRSTFARRHPDKRRPARVGLRG